MKKLITLLSIVSIVLTSNAQVKNEDFSHLSLGLKGGALMMRESGPSNATKDRLNYWGGVDLEYTFNPMWGLGLNYSYLPYSQDYPEIGKKVTATANEITAYLSVNFSNWLAPYRCGNWQRLNFYGNIGAGVSLFDYDNTFSGLKDNGNCLVVPTGLTIEYNFSKVFAMNIGGEYRWHNEWDMKQDAQNVVRGNEFLLASLGFKFKFGGEKRHIRNVSYVSYKEARTEDRYTPAIIALQEEILILNKKINDQDIVSRELGVATLEQAEAIKLLETKLNSVSQNLSSKDRKTAEEIAAIKKAQETIAKDVFNTLEFETGSAVIKSSSHKSLNKLAETLSANPSWNLRLKGYTDNTGSHEKNITLSKERANAVKHYLNEKGISSNRITAEGYGPENPIASNATAEGRSQNRRVEIEID